MLNRSASWIGQRKRFLATNSYISTVQPFFLGSCRSISRKSVTIPSDGTLIPSNTLLFRRNHWPWCRCTTNTASRHMVNPWHWRCAVFSLDVRLSRTSRISRRSQIALDIPINRATSNATRFRNHGFPQSTNTPRALAGHESENTDVVQVNSISASLRALSLAIRHSDGYSHRRWC